MRNLFFVPLRGMSLKTKLKNIEHKAVKERIFRPPSGNEFKN